MTLNFLGFNDPKLKNLCPPLSLDEISYRETQDFIQQFLKFCGHETTPTSKTKITRMVGCAAPQVGFMKQIIIVDAAINPFKHNFHEVDFHVLINPRIIWSSKETSCYPESCYSIPFCYSGLIERPIAVVIEAYNANKTRIRRRYEGYTARVVQHEIDHLYGIRFPQKAFSKESIHKINFTNREEFIKYKSHWRHWNSFVNHEEYLLLKKGHYDNVK